ncbi:dipeptidase PepE [Pleionea litopenaei]|uniref:Dipeptidase PepE n=1 Tax=Pleionea litopenaei TaxID=3070815 RepID=A0AA51RV63_9GAMM|nr:dipeptidase PepE [Pleionea sp. HL-JVS1]WMS88216.1 dipeptidase PepE [Pleionea sp. HL-JVS1]
MRQLLLLSSSREGQSGYLETAQLQIKAFLKECDFSSNDEILFIPFAGVSIDYDQYHDMVQQALQASDIKVTALHHSEDPATAIKKAKAIMVGGGNTFHLLHQLYQFELLGLIRDAVIAGVPYIGWSAGSNIAAPNIKTTNDMPIVQPPSFHALHLVPFQINPHYIDQHPPGFNGETREQRINEFLLVNPDSKVVGLPEGSALKIFDNRVELLGNHQAFIFADGKKDALDVSQLEKMLKESLD